MKKEISPKLFSLTFGVLVLCFVAAFYVVAWQEPTQTPPEGNVPSPINVGTDPQAKAGRISATEFYDYNDPSYYLNPSGDSNLSDNLTVGGVIDFNNCTFDAFKEVISGSETVFVPTYICGAGCNCGSWQDQGCGAGGCSASQMYQTRDCTPDGCDTESRCYADPGCGCSCGGWVDQGCGAGGCSASLMYQIRDCTPDGCDTESRCYADSDCVVCECRGLPYDQCCSDGCNYDPDGTCCSVGNNRACLNHQCIDFPTYSVNCFGESGTCNQICENSGYYGCASHNREWSCWLQDNCQVQLGIIQDSFTTCDNSCFQTKVCTSPMQCAAQISGSQSQLLRSDSCECYICP